ncbi:MAG TPA: LPS export ABC transporter periplasmic protein LptC [Candidatus Avirikenella pullistercoris]|nr:LPS export ABC transporter periplasmic protein LptC [Candidatus Avirikenella pullistercoris]
MMVALLCWSAIFLYGCSSQVDADVEIDDPAKMATLSSDNLTITYYENGKMSYRFTTPLLQRYEFAEEPYMEFLKGIKIITFDSTQSKVSELVADYAKYLEKEQLWEAKGNVIGEDQEGKKLLTEQLFWDEKADRIYSNVDTKVINGDEVTVGTGFESDGQLNNITFRETKGRILIDTMRNRTDSATVFSVVQNGE